jgi:CubicO group peptidase (beta-lactamase class C family)
MLDYIIEKITGQSHANFVEKQIFKKLEMTASQYASHREVIQNSASGYHNKDGYINSREISFTLPYSSGSLMSNIYDMFKWQEAIKNNLLIGKEKTEKAFMNYTLNNGEHINYAYGWHIKTINGISIRDHGGAIFDFKSMVYIFLMKIFMLLD